MNKQYKIICFICLLLGCAIGYAIGIVNNKTDIANNTQNTANFHKPENDNTVIQPEDSSKEEVIKLENEIQSLQQRNEETQQKLIDIKKEQEEREQNRQKRFERIAEARNNNRTNRIFLNLQNSTNLTDDQLTSIEGFLKEQGLKLDEYRKSIADGEFDWREFRQKESELFGANAIKDFLSDVLSDEQMETYEQYSTKRSEDLLEANAYREISRLLRSIPLNEEQKNVIFESNYNETFSVTEEELLQFSNETGENISKREYEQLKKDELYKSLLDENQWILYESTKSRGWRR